MEILPVPMHTVKFPSHSKSEMIQQSSPNRVYSRRADYGDCSVTDCPMGQLPHGKGTGPTYLCIRCTRGRGW
jgi:hypothetical protein